MLDWRLSPIELELRDSFFTHMKFKIETAVKRHNRPGIVFAHSMGNNIFMYFCDWLRYVDKPSIGWNKWLRKHIWSYVGFSAPLLGSPAALKSVLSGHSFGLPISEAQARSIEVTFPSTHLLNPRSSRPKDKKDTTMTAKSWSRSDSSKSNTGSDSGINSTDIYDDDYTLYDPIVSVKSGTSGRTVMNFGVDDIESGDIFKWLGNMYKDPALIEKYRSLVDRYQKDPLKPLDKLYRRPPIKHVVMIYGVDLPTEVAYTYRLPDQQTENSNEPIFPILEETFIEETCVGKKADVNDTVADKIALKKKTSNKSSAKSTIEGLVDLSLFDKVNPWLRKTVSEKKKVTSSDSNDPTIDNYLSGTSKASVEISVGTVDIVETEQTVEKIIETVTERIEDNGASGTVFGQGNLDATTILNLLNKIPVQINSGKDVDSSEQHIIDSEVVEGIENDPLLEFCKDLTISDSKSADENVRECVTNIVSMRKSTMISQQKRHVRSCSLKHSGDFTVPYASLSYAKTWLDDNKDRNSNKSTSSFGLSNNSTSNRNNQSIVIKKWSKFLPQRVHKHALDGWTPFNMAAAISSIDPATELHFSERINGDSTFIMEVSGVDHLDIAKHPYIHGLLFEYLLPKMAEDLCLNKTCESFQYKDTYYSGEALSVPTSSYFEFPLLPSLTSNPLAMLWDEAKKYLIKFQRHVNEDQ